jgi:hypothetical protein
LSIQTALDNIFLRPSARWAHTEYSLHYHKDYIAKRTGSLPDDRELTRKGYDRFGLDLIWNANDGLVDWAKAGRTTDMGHASYASDGSDQRKSKDSPFKSTEDVWAFEQQIQRVRNVFPNQLTTGGYYKTIVSGAIESFGWNMLLMAASDPRKMDRVFDGFFRRALFHMKAWARTSVEVVIQHDDFVWANGPFMRPAIYRELLIPRYAELWKPLHEAGKKVLFCSDGDFTAFAGDVAGAGTDGFIFEPCMDFGNMVDRFGKTHCLVGSFVDCRDLTLGEWDKVRDCMDRTFDRLKECRGAIVSVGNHLPPNIPEDMLDRYFEKLLPRLER